MNKSTAWSVVRSTLASDLACGEQLLAEPGIRVVPNQELSGRRRYPFRPDSLLMASLGLSVVLSCPVGWLDLARQAVAELQERDDAFAAPFISRLQREFALPQCQVVVGPVLKFCCSNDSLRPVHSLVMTELVEGGALKSLCSLEGFPHALTRKVDGPRPDVLAAVAYQDGRVAAIAGATADTDTLWQVGVDVLPEYRGRGIGQAVVHALTKAVLERSALPHYSTAPSNIASRALAISVGYWPSWVELFTM